jgi:nucleoside-diphosphate-sugar epimerase
LQIAREHNIPKVVYCSTQGVHGNVQSPPGDENSPIKPEDYYQYTKYEAEKVVQEFIKQGMDITILRPTALYGPGDPGRFLMLFKQVKTGKFPFFGDGKAFYHPVYVENFVDACELAVKQPGAKGNVYLIADQNYYSIEQIVTKIAQVMNIDLKIFHLPFMPLYWLSALVELLYKPLPLEPPIFRRRADWFRQNRAFKIDAAKRDLQYTPRVELDEGLRLTYKWYVDNGYL